MSNSTSACDHRGEDTSSNKKVSTSCAQKVKSCNNDGVDHNNSSNSSSGIDAVAESISRVDISNDYLGKMALSDDKLFQDPPPKEDCPICMLPTPHALSGCGVNMVYQACCGKFICEGCSMAEDDEMR
jgi:hypothetical protein